MPAGSALMQPHHASYANQLQLSGINVATFSGGQNLASSSNSAPPSLADRPSPMPGTSQSISGGFAPMNSTKSQPSVAQPSVVTRLTNAVDDVVKGEPLLGFGIVPRGGL